MARKYSPENLMAPGGYLSLSMFPGLDDAARTARLEAYLDDGYRKATGATDEDEAALAWAYHRAFMARVLDLSNQAATITVPNEVTITRTNDQLGTLANLAKEWQATFYGYFATGSTNDLNIPASGTSKTHFGWGGTLRG